MCFLEATSSEGELRVNVSGIYLAGKANIKSLVASSQSLDLRLSKAVIQVGPELLHPLSSPLSTQLDTKLSRLNSRRLLDAWSTYFSVRKLAYDRWRPCSAFSCAREA